MKKNEENLMKKIYIIAEAGVNHNGSTEIAKKLIRKSYECGADAVKFQTFNTDKTIKKTAKMASYQKKNLGYETSQYEMVKNLELSFEQHKILFEYGKKIGIEVLSTPFDLSSVDLLEKLNVRIYKIGSGELTNYPLIDKIMATNKPIILSTGMATIKEIEETVNYINEKGNISLSLLHCVTNYPPKFVNVNLNVIKKLKEKFFLKIGYSDHTIGIEVPIAAVALGAEIIEKHITLDKKMKGPDHKVSLEPDEFRKMVRCIRNVEESLGDGIKVIQKEEENIKLIARKSLVYKKNFKKNHILSEKDFGFKRPGDGIYPKFIKNVIGKRLNKDVIKDETVRWEELEDEK